MGTFYIADTHFDSKNIIKYDKRPFNSVKEMNEVMIDNWNSIIKPSDTVNILGDFCWSGDERWEYFLKTLNGVKNLIRGNHDPKKFNASIRVLLNDVIDYKEIKDNKRHVIECHFPILMYNKSYSTKHYMLHGHVHKYTEEAAQLESFITQLKIDGTKPLKSGEVHNKAQLINVGCMMEYMNYTPRTLDYLISKVK